jgi:very-short-patch-repair endonuclease
LFKATAHNRNGCRIASVVSVGKDNIIFNRHSKKDVRRKLRNFGTAAEAVLWKHLQRKQILGKLFRRQVSIGRYIVDFYCAECRLIVELDGAPHFSVLMEELEAERTRYLEGLGLQILRFENRALRHNLPFVLHRIEDELRRSKRRP